MKTNTDLNGDVINVDTGELNRNVLRFCGSVLCYFQEVLDERERHICLNLIKGRTILSVADELYLTRERVRQIFVKSISKINDAYTEAIEEMETYKRKCEVLKHRNDILESELLSEEGRKHAQSVIAQEGSLCNKALNLLNAPVGQLPLNHRVKNALWNAGAMKFSEIPQLSNDRLMGLRQCGRKTVTDITKYLAKFSLRLGMTYEEIVKKLTTLSEEDIPIEDLQQGIPIMKEDEISSHLMSDNIPVDITLEDFYEEVGYNKRSKKKWRTKIRHILERYNINTLEELLLFTPSEFKELNGVGPSTLQHIKRGLSKCGITWPDVHK